MKRILFLAAALLVLSLSARAQVFNTGTTLDNRQFSVGLNPVFWDGDFGFFLHGGAGIKSGIDLGLHYGAINGRSNYVGADLEWQFLGGMPSLSLATGGHVIGSTFGIDASFNMSFPIRGDADIYTGIDGDMNFYDSGSNLLLWLPVGVELGIRRGFSLLLEGEVGLTDAAYHVFGGGVAFYF